jgi:hypothetical protein
MNSLQSRKQLLIAESDLNRAQLIEDWKSMEDGVRSVADRARSFNAIASSAAALVAGLAAYRLGKRAREATKPSWLRSILKGASLVSSVWLAFNSPSRRRD